jgi:hypothetical protein
VGLRHHNAARGICFEDPHGVVSAAIINGVNAEILMGLAQHTVEGTTNTVFNVVARNDDIYFGVRW